MIGLYTAEEVRAAEEPLLAATPEGTLMLRAATGLATVCLRLLGRSYGARVALLVGAGNNGGDALFAGAHLARRGAQVTAVLLVPEKAHAAGLAALRRAGGRAVPAASETALDRADLVLDGIVGIGGPEASARRPPRWPSGPHADRASRSPSTCPAGSTPPPARSRGRRSTPCTRSPSAP